MYGSVDGDVDGYHVKYLGAHTASGFGLVLPEQTSITPDGRTATSPAPRSGTTVRSRDTCTSCRSSRAPQPLARGPASVDP
jgi:hypothetical protein